MLDKIIVRGARANNLNNVDVDIPRDKLVVMTGLPAPENLLWHLTPSLQTVSAAIWRACRPTHVSSWDRWKSRMWTALRLVPGDFH